MYTVAGWQNQQPEHKYFDYGYYNFSSETGPRVIVNNQTGGATVTGYYNYGGTGPVLQSRFVICRVGEAGVCGAALTEGDGHLTIMVCENSEQRGGRRCHRR